MPSLSELLALLSQIKEEKETPEPVAESTGFRLSDTVADPMSKPFGWQTEAPIDLFRKGDPVGDSADLQRILALPRRAPLDLDSVTAQAMIELEMKKHGRDNPNCDCKQIDPRRPCLKRLLPVQAWALREMSLCQGLLLSATVGSGKTVLDILGAMALDNVQEVLLLIPASLRGQIQLDYQLISQHFKVPGLVMHIGNEKPMFPRVIHAGRPTLNVMPYSRLSLHTETNFIAGLNPDAIICDEVDQVRSMASSRGIRLAKWFAGGETDDEKRKRQSTKFLGWTGSLTDHSITEFNWLSLFALKEKSPLPLNPQVVEEWGRCLDATTSPSPPGELLQFCEPGEDVRQAYGRRLAETPGFIIANVNTVQITGGEGNVELVIREKQAPELPAIIVAALGMVRKGIRPDSLIAEVRPDLVKDGVGFADEELEDAMAIARAAQEVSVGVLYFWTFPRGEPAPLIKQWMAARRNFNCEVREQSLLGETYLDSAMLCEQAAMRFWGQADKRDDRPEWRCESWPAWLAIRDQVEPQTDSCVLHPFIAEDAADWGKENNGIIWYQMRALAVKMRELSGLPIHDGGVKGEARLRAETGGRSIISSIRSNGRGRDGLQHIFHKQLVVNPPANSTGWEQLLGRNHRRGQKSEVVSTEVYLHTPELRKAFDQATRRSKYVEELLKTNQKLLQGWKP